MFFYLSKILMFLLTPIVWFIVLFVLYVFTKKKKRKKFFLISLISIFFILSNSFIADEAFRAWEIKAISDKNINQVYDYGVVLGGVTWYDSKLERLGIVRSYDRVLQAVELYKKGKIRKIFISGGSGSILNPDFNESSIVKEHLVRIGIPAIDIEYEDNSRNTRENALETKKKLSNKSKILLITSAFHMRRASACFNKVELKVTPYVVDRYSGQRKFVFDHMFIPNIDALSNWTLLIHEIAGYLVYLSAGYL